MRCWLCNANRAPSWAAAAGTWCPPRCCGSPPMSVCWRRSCGSERAFEALLRSPSPPVLALPAHVGSREEAEDVVQLTFQAAPPGPQDAGEPPFALRPWLYGIARHRCLSVLRARLVQHPVEEVPEPATDHLDTEIAMRDDLRAILADVARLPDDQRAALVLAELGDVSYDEIARILACPRAKVKALVFQARSSLTAARAARETPCAEIREQLATLRGSALLRATLRRHIHDCPGCRAFREQLRNQRRQLGLLLPVIFRPSGSSAPSSARCSARALAQEARRHCRHAERRRTGYGGRGPGHPGRRHHGGRTCLP